MTRAMKKYTVLFMAALFCVMCLSLYMMLESATQWQSSRISALGENELSSIEVKIKEIESILQHNQRTINHIKDTVRELAKGNADSIARLDQIFNGESAQPIIESRPVDEAGAVALVESRLEVVDQCWWSNRSARTDINMLDVVQKLSFEDKDGGVWKQGFPITYSVDQWSDRPLKVFVVPHSHNDPGWIKTFDRYFEDQTKKILDNMLTYLSEDKRMKFIYAEMSFFSHWWHDLDDERRKTVKKLIQTGQLELVTGGWVMSDEANVHYYSMLDQLIEGHQWIKNQIGVVPISSWSIDPFGHSATMAYLLRKSGIDNMLIQRVHYSIKKYLASRKQLEFMWRQDWDTSGDTAVLCHLMPFFSYDVPHTCGPDPKVCCQFDFKRLPGGRVACPWRVAPQVITKTNVEQRAGLLLDQYRKKAQLYHTDVVLAPLGDDFRYDTTIEWKHQMDNYQKLINFMNDKKEWNVEIQFGTLSDFFAATRERWTRPNTTSLSGVPSLSGDFYTYADRQDHYWAGYFTSRPFHKSLDRVLEAHLRAAELIFSLSQAYTRRIINANFPVKMLMKNLVTARRALALFQHHDAITGTAKDHVVVDYGQRLISALSSCKNILKECAYYLSSPDKLTYKPEENVFDVDEIRRSHDSLPEKTIIKLSDEPTAVLFYNSLPRKRRVLVRVYVNSPNVEVRDPANTVIRSQVDPYWFNNEDIAKDIFKLVFVVDVPGLGLARYMLTSVDDRHNSFNTPATVDVYNTNGHSILKNGPFQITSWMDAEKFTMENAHLKLTFSSETGTLQSTLRKDADITIDTEIEFVTYTARNTKEKSGAYLFLPDGPPKRVKSDTLYIRLVRGALLQEVHVFMPMLEHVVRLYNTRDSMSNAVEVFNIVDIRKSTNTELAMRVKTSVKNNKGEFYSDLNAFQMTRRAFHAKLPLQANYYPMTSMAYVEDAKSRFSLITAQSLGVSSPEQGVLEVMLDRRLNQDDNRGLAQALVDNRRTPNKFLLLWERRVENDDHHTQPPPSQTGYPSLLAHELSANLVHPLIVIPQVTTSENPIAKLVAPLWRDLPCDLHLVNIRTMQNEESNPEVQFFPKLTSLLLLHRLGYDCNYPKVDMTCNTTTNGTLDLSGLFRDLTIADVQNVSLSLLKEGAVLSSTRVHVPVLELAAYQISIR